MWVIVQLWLSKLLEEYLISDFSLAIFNHQSFYHDFSSTLANQLFHHFGHLDFINQNLDITIFLHTRMWSKGKKKIDTVWLDIDYSILDKNNKRYEIP
jgi:hypothetical protein